METQLSQTRIIKLGMECSASLYSAWGSKGNMFIKITKGFDPKVEWCFFYQSCNGLGPLCLLLGEQVAKGVLFNLLN